ncbi:response regulator transcription factor [Paenibacillus chartarius]|uniref:Response regulator transcription factor n=1 Tax=Paenibacillus chartarius TaxID=747481 RepID=A0ABV6DF00_9BACL
MDPYVLIVEDDDNISEMMTFYLSEEGYIIERAGTGPEGLEMFEARKPHAIVLDIMLPGLDGISLCQQIRRKSSVPILMVSAKHEVSERVNALLVGADDYLCKPFSMREFAARIKALLRRSQLNGGAEQPGEREDISPIAIDVERRTLFVRGAAVETTFSEFEIIKLFYQNPGKVYSRDELLNRIRGFDSFVTERAIDVHIANLRKKVEADPKEPKYIKTVWGVGYKFILE